MDVIKTIKRMKSIKEKAQEVKTELLLNRASIPEIYEAGANYVLSAIIDCLPKTHSFNPNEAIDIIASRIKQLKK